MNLQIKRYKLHLLIIIFYFTIYFFTSPGSLGGDSQLRFEVGKNFANNFSLTLPHDFDFGKATVVENKRGENVLYYPPLVQLLYAGTIKVADFFIDILDIDGLKNNIEEFFCSIWGPIWGAFLMLAIFLILKRLAFSDKTSFFVTAVLGLSTNLWLLIVTSSNNIPQALFILYGFYFFICYYYEENKNMLVLSGLMLGLGLLTRITTGLYLFSFFLVFFVSYSKKNGLQVTFTRSLYFIYPQFIAGIIILIFNYIKFESFFKVGLQSSFYFFEVPILKGLVYEFLDPAYGIIPNLPHIVFGLVVVLFLIKKKFDGFINYLIIFTSIVLLLFFAKFLILGYSEYGPRFTIPILILWSLYLAYLVRNKGVYFKIFRILFFIFVIIEFLATLTSVDRIYYQFNGIDLDKETRFNYRYCRWFTQVESSIAVLQNLPNINKNDLHFNLEKVDKSYFEKHSVAFNFIIYWWARLWFLNIPWWVITGIGVFFISIIYFLYKKIFFMLS